MKNVSKFLILAFLISQLFVVKPVVAQDDYHVVFSPDPTNLYLNGTNKQVVDIWIKNANDPLNAFDIRMHYDSTIAVIEQWNPGDFLEIEKGFCFVKINDPGHLWIVCAQLNKPGKSGEGIVLKLTFTGKGYGTINPTIDNAIFMRKADDTKTYPRVVVPTINATYNPGIIKPVNLNGSVSMQGRTTQSGANIRLTGQVIGRGYSGASTDASGNNYIFNNIAMDLYTVWTNTQGYLNIPANMNKQMALIGAETTLNPLHLVAGNAVWTDNVININDFSLVAGNFGKTNYDSRADINGNGKVDIFDLALVAGNFGKTSEEEYASWQP